MKLIHRLAQAVEARQNCIKRKNEEWIQKWEEIISRLGGLLPSGSGFDSGTVVVLEKSNPKEFQFRTAFHHMKEGYYTKWTDHLIVVTPVLTPDLFDMHITGQDHEGIKEYLHEIFYHTLHNDVPDDFLVDIFERKKKTEVKDGTIS